jgi:hypothetical protein
MKKKYDDWISGISAYLLILYNVNKNFLKVCGLEADFNGFFELENLFLTISQDIYKLIPYKYNNKTNNIELLKDDGLLCFKDTFSYLYDDLKLLFDNNNSILNDLKSIRDKTQHAPHKIRATISNSGTLDLPETNFELKTTINGNISTINFIIQAKKIKKLLLELNILYDKLIDELIQYSHEKDLDDNNYIRKNTKFKFMTFNEIYNSEVLKNCGRIMKEF